MLKFNRKSPLIKQILSFLFVGGICYVISIALLLFFVEIVHIEVNLSNLLASLITMLVCYLLNSKYVFKGGRYSRKKEVLAFFTFSTISLVLNVTLMYLMTTYLPIWYVISKTLITGFITIFNFTVRKKFVFLE